MGLRFNFKWLLMSLALSVVLTLVVRALTGVWFLGFFLFLPFGMSFGSKSWGSGTDVKPVAQPTGTATDTFNSTPYTQDELRKPGGALDSGQS